MTQIGHEDAARPLTGRKVLTIAICAFGAIIAANLTLAYSAVQSFPGVEVKNGYIASQSFEQERAAQERLGWRTEAAFENGELQIIIRDRDGRPAPLQDAVVHIGRPTTAASILKMSPADGGAGWTAAVSLAPGPWRIDVKGRTPEGDRFRQHLMVEGTR